MSEADERTAPAPAGGEATEAPPAAAGAATVAQPEKAAEPRRPPLRIGMVASELTPFAKTGGLADVASALAAHLHRQGHDVRVVLPLYATMQGSDHRFTRVDFLRDLPLDMGRWSFQLSVFTAPLPGSGLPVYFVHCPALYGRESIYGGEWDEYLRFGALCRASLEIYQRMGWSPQVLHAHDWHTALLPLYIKTIYGWDQLFKPTRSVLTLHNLGYQGVFGAEVLHDLGLAHHAELLYQQDLKAGRFNFLKTGLLYADVITTVSRTYAAEIQTAEHGMGLEHLLVARRNSIVGIVNGVDYEEWSPDKDREIPHPYSAGSLDGKRKNKLYLLEQMKLPQRAERPLLGIVSRLTGQKGFDLLFDTLPPVLKERDVALTVLGSGEPRYVEFFTWLQQAFPSQVSFYHGYSNRLAHLVEAGADIFLMPSRYEPCGLNQMYSLRYGTIPVVRKTGGLADTVQLYNPRDDSGTGFVFDHYTPAGFAWALEAALDTYTEDPEAWRRLIKRAMARDYSWEHQGAEYVRLYRTLVGA